MNSQPTLAGGIDMPDLSDRDWPLRPGTVWERWFVHEGLGATAFFVMQTQQEVSIARVSDTVMESFELPFGTATFEEDVQDGRGNERATRRAAEFLCCLAARIRSLCAFVSAQPVPRGGAAFACKRVLDVVGAVLLLLLLLPVITICSLLVLVSSPGPVFFKHRRVGIGGRDFNVWKFRTMCKQPDQILARFLATNPQARAEWLATQKLADDPRVFPVGRFMRRFSLDELPQLWNVIKGEMSLVGPRPIVAAEVGRYGEAIEAYYAVRPGMTGLWQVSGRSQTTYAERVKLDRQYVEEWSLKLDTAIFLRTFRSVVTAKGAC